MSIHKFLSALAGGALVAVAAAAPFAEDRQTNRAIELITHAQKGDFRVNVEAILRQRDPAGSGWQVVKVVRSKDGKQRSKIVAPLRSSQVESIDDGVRKKTYLPDDKVILDEASSANGDSEITERLKRARQNYTFTIENVADIAGRRAVCVVAKPHAAELDTRRYFLDAKTGYPLKLEIVPENASPVVMFQIQAIKYPDTLPASSFKLEVFPDVQTIRYDRPAKSDPALASTQVGFTPYIPQSLPLGFKLQEIQYNKTDVWKSVVIRMNDGLARVTVYEWIPDDKPKTVMGDSSSRDYNGVRIVVVSELGPAVRDKILDAVTGQQGLRPRGRGKGGRSGGATVSSGGFLLYRRPQEVHMARELAPIPPAFRFLDAPAGFAAEAICQASEYSVLE